MQNIGNYSPQITVIRIRLYGRLSIIRVIRARLGVAFRLRGTAKRRFGATTAGEAWVIRV